MSTDTIGKRLANLRWSHNHLLENGITFEVKNHGYHYVVHCHNGGKIDFYPTTGRYLVQGSALNGRGVSRVVLLACQEEPFPDVQVLGYSSRRGIKGKPKEIPSEGIYNPPWEVDQ